MSIETKQHAPAIEHTYSLLLTCLYGIFHLLKSSAYAKEGRFWAEEGYFFFDDISRLSILDGLGYLFNGHIEFITNIVVVLATLVPLDQAPLVTTHLSALLQALPIVMIIIYRHELRIGKAALLGLLIAVVGMPQATEVWANAINLHFHFAILAALLIALPVPDTPHMAWLFRALLLSAGLSGIPANFLLPVALYRATLDKKRERWIQLAILSGTTALQLSLLASHQFDAGSRHLALPVTVFWFATLTQSIVAPLSGVFIGHQVSTILRDPHFLNLPKIFFPLLLCLPLVALIMDAFKDQVPTKRILALSALTLAALSMLTALGIKEDLISPRAAGRYFYASNVLWATLFFGYMRWRNGYTVVLTLALTWSSLRNLIDDQPQGPNWSASVQQARSNRAATIAIWPQGWTMPNPEEPLLRPLGPKRPPHIGE